jgi:ubiquinone/menaquinone biosynthesis C-methylase UbiE
MNNTHHKEIQRIQHLYEKSYASDPEDWSYVWNPRNAISYFFRQQRERAIIRTLNRAKIRLTDMSILDLGCGNGDLLRFFIELGAESTKCAGIDLVPARIEDAKRKSPSGIRYSIGDVSSLTFPDASVDLISLFTVFSSIHDIGIRREIAQMAMRTIKPGGYILWFDLCQHNSDPKKAQGISERDIRSLFRGLDVLSSRRLFQTMSLACIERGWFWAAELFESLPVGRRSNLLLLMQKPNS